ncbi:ankyrin repeat protein, partial [Trichophaea hybrida]
DNRHAKQRTPLIISVQKGLAGATQLFLNLKMDVNAKDDCGRTALHYAVESGDEPTLQLLMKQGANKSARDNCNETALHLAVK